MPRKDGAVIGVSDHGGWAVMITADARGTLLDRRRVELVDADLPKIPHHSEAQSLPVEQAVQLIERVRASAERHSALVLDAIATTVGEGVRGIALRQCPELPETIAERITNYRASNVADWVMYRRALERAAEAKGWAVHWFDPREADDAGRQYASMRAEVGPPWGQDQRMAMAAAVAGALALQKPQAPHR